MTFLAIRVLRALGLAKDVVDLQSMTDKKRKNADRLAA